MKLMSEFTPAELNSVHYVKVLLCYLLNKLNRSVTEKQLYEIVLDSGVINYFYYTEALGELIENKSAERVKRGEEAFIELTEKGRHGADYFNETVPRYFRHRILKAAMYYFARLERESEANVKIVSTERGYEVQCGISDADYDLMRISLYAPDGEQAELIRDKLMLDPAGFYRRVIGFALENEEERIEIDAD